jgi:RhtX/FptX family siderophore transporter
MKKYSFDITTLYLAQAISLYFCTFGLPTILRSEGISLEKIGLFSFLLLPWVIKFLWAPIVDKKYSKKFGRRRSWFLIMQLFTILLFLIFSIYNPKDHSNGIFLLAFLLSTIAATQDISVDGFSIEQTEAKNLQWSNFYRVIGTTLGSMIGGASLIALYNILGWHKITLYIAIISICIYLYMFTIKEKSENTQYQRAIPSLKSFFKRKETKALLIICLSYRACEGLVMGMQSSFLVDTHIPLSTIGIVMGTGSAIIGIFGAAIISYLFNFYKDTALLTLLAVIRGFCYFSLGIISLYNIDNQIIIFAIVLLNMASRLMEMIVLYTIFMKFSSKDQAGTDFTILVCVELLIYILGMSISGFLAANIGYTMLFIIGGALSIPGFLIAYILLKNIYSQMAI